MKVFVRRSDSFITPEYEFNLQIPEPKLGNTTSFFSSSPRLLLIISTSFPRPFLPFIHPSFCPTDFFSEFLCSSSLQRLHPAGGGGSTPDHIKVQSFCTLFHFFKELETGGYVGQASRKTCCWSLEVNSG